MLDISMTDLLKEATYKGCSDLHITEGVSPMVRIDGKIIALGHYPIISSEMSRELTYTLVDAERREILEQEGDVDFSFCMEEVGRFRINAFKQSKRYSLAIRILMNHIPALESLGFPESIKALVEKSGGLILVTGPTGSGKSTSLASMINFINHTRNAHIITIEDPIEYLYQHNQCVINQREVGEDTKTFSRAIRAAMREDPDVILVGEMRDLETIQAAITAAETGHLVLSTLHTKGAAHTVDRIIDVFPPSQQRQIRIQLAHVLEGVISQNLVVRKDGKGRTLAMEVMLMNDAIRNLIREEKVYQINTVIQTSMKQGMQTLDGHLAVLVHEGTISIQEALNHCIHPETLKRHLYK
ncbi:MAG: type IV pilus twitching motility protein PilT [Niameybacter sp.]